MRPPDPWNKKFLPDPKFSSSHDPELEGEVFYQETLGFPVLAEAATHRRQKQAKLSLGQGQHPSSSEKARCLPRTHYIS